MKKTITILLIVAFFVQATSHIWLLSAFYINRNYIAANLCINRFDKIPVCKGSCFLENQINEKNKEQKESFPELKLKVNVLFCQNNHIAEQTAVEFGLTDSYCLYIHASYSSQFIQSVFHPPCRIV